MTDAVLEGEEGGDVAVPFERCEVAHGPLRTDALETVAVFSSQPGSHVAAVRAAQHPDPVSYRKTSIDQVLHRAPT